MEDRFVQELCSFWVRTGVISHAEALSYRERFAESDHDSFEDFVYEEGLINKQNILEALAAYYQVPAVDVEGVFFDGELLRNFPKDFLVRNEIVPLALEEDVLVMVSANPHDMTLVPRIGMYANTDVQLNVGLGRSIIEAVEEYYDKAVTEVAEDADLETEHRELEEFERAGRLPEDKE